MRSNPVYEMANTTAWKLRFTLNHCKTLRAFTNPPGISTAGVNFSGHFPYLLGIIAPAYGPVYDGWDPDPTVLQSAVGDILTVNLPGGVTAVGTDMDTTETLNAPPYTFGGPVQVALGTGETFM